MPVPLHTAMYRLVKARECMSIAVIGCGAVGSLFAANLGTLDEVEVWAYDPWQEHVDAINATACGSPARATSSAASRRLPTRRRSRRASSGSSP